LTESAPEGNDPEADALKALPPRWEVRIQAERDPVAEETKIYRGIAHEVDKRYDKYDKGQSR
jgi:hypothetical protein